MSLRRILLVVAFALVLVVTMLPSGPKEIAVSYSLREMDDFRRDKFQREALAFHAEVAEPIALRMLELVRPYASLPPRLFGERPEPLAVVSFVVEEAMPAWARGELRRHGKPITPENADALFKATPAWQEIIALSDLFHGSEGLPKSVEHPNTSIPKAQEWLAEFRGTAVQLQVLGEDKVVSTAESE